MLSKFGRHGETSEDGLGTTIQRNPQSMPVGWSWTPTEISVVTRRWHLRQGYAHWVLVTRLERRGCGVLLKKRLRHFARVGQARLAGPWGMVPLSQPMFTQPQHHACITTQSLGGYDET